MRVESTDDMSELELLNAKTGRRVTVEIPGAIGNLGAGLDTFGLAIGLYCRITFVLLENNDPDIPFVTFSGPVVQESLPDETGKLVYKILKELWKDDRTRLERIRIHVQSEIPLGSGLGGGTAPILGALWADQVFKDVVPTTAELLARATAWEGQAHSETFAASLMGDFVNVVNCADGKRVLARQHNWPEPWSLLLCVPQYRLNTATSKSILPKKVPFADAMFNMQRSALMVSAVVSNSVECLKEALQDRLHERYREVLVPELAPLKDLVRDLPAHGCVLSGGGSSVLVIVDENFKPQVKDRLDEWAQTRPQPPRILDVAVDRRGLRTISL